MNVLENGSKFLCKAAGILNIIITGKLRKLVAIHVFYFRLLFKMPAGNKLGRHKTGTNLSG